MTLPKFNHLEKEVRFLEIGHIPDSDMTEYLKEDIIK